MLDINTLRFEVQLNKLDNSQLVLVEYLLDRIETAEKERDALRAKVAAMEKQEPVAWIGRGPRDGQIEFRGEIQRVCNAMQDSMKAIRSHGGRTGSGHTYEQSLPMGVKP